MAVHVRHNNVSLRVHGYVTRIIQLSVTIAKWAKLERLTCKNGREQYVTRRCKALVSQKTARCTMYTQLAKSAGRKRANKSRIGFVLPWLAKEGARHSLTNHMAGQGNITVKLRLIDGLLTMDPSAFFFFLIFNFWLGALSENPLTGL